MDLQLKDNRARVTGSTAGIGFAIAGALACEGTSVVVNGRTRERVNSAVNEIRPHTPHANVRGVAADLSTIAAFSRQNLREHYRYRLTEYLGNQCDDRGPFVPALLAEDAGCEWGQNPLHFERIRSPPSGRNDRLSHDQDRADIPGTRARGNDDRHRSDSKFDSRRTEATGRGGAVCSSACEVGGCGGGRDRNKVSHGRKSLWPRYFFFQWHARRPPRKRLEMRSVDYSRRALAAACTNPVLSPTWSKWNPDQRPSLLLQFLLCEDQDLFRRQSLIG